MKNVRQCGKCLAYQWMWETCVDVSGDFVGEGGGIPVANIRFEIGGPWDINIPFLVYDSRASGQRNILVNICPPTLVPRKEIGVKRFALGWFRAYCISKYHFLRWRIFSVGRYLSKTPLSILFRSSVGAFMLKFRGISSVGGKNAHRAQKKHPRMYLMAEAQGNPY